MWNARNVHKFGLQNGKQVLKATWHLYLQTRPESNILGELSLKVKKLLALTGDVKTIFKLKDF